MEADRKRWLNAHKPRFVRGDEFGIDLDKSRVARKRGQYKPRKPGGGTIPQPRLRK